MTHPRVQDPPVERVVRVVHRQVKPERLQNHELEPDDLLCRVGAEPEHARELARVVEALLHLARDKEHRPPGSGDVVRRCACVHERPALRAAVLSARARACAATHRICLGWCSSTECCK